MMESRTRETQALALEFGVAEDLMGRFVDRFAPDRVAERAYYETPDVMLFVHVPKTAGMSVGRSLRSAFDIFRGVNWLEVSKSFRQQTREAMHLKNVSQERQVIMGHFGWTEMQIWRVHELKLKCGAIIRDPVARIVSNYNYNCSEAHPENMSFRARYPNLLSYAKDLTYDVQLTQMVGMVDSFANALDKLVRYYSFLGVTEHLSLSLQHLGRSHGLSKLTEYHENVGRGTSADDDADTKIRQLVERKSPNDLRLHRLLMKVFDTAQA